MREQEEAEKITMQDNERDRLSERDESECAEEEEGGCHCSRRHWC